MPDPEHFPFVVIGGGPAGLSAARAYREAGGAGPVALIADEGRIPYRRPPLSKELLRGEMSEDDLPLESETWFAEQEIHLVADHAEGLDPEARRVGLSSGRRITYETCLIATGAEPVRLPVPGAEDPAVAVLRSLDGLRELLARLAPGADVTVIGSGFIGCEIAASLSLRGHPVTLVSDEPAPNRGRLGDAAAARIADWLGELGVTLALGAPVSAIHRHDDQLTVETTAASDATGSVEHPASLVVMAAGVRPRGELAAAAGIALADGAVPVDRAMRTSTHGVLAAGDVAHADHAVAGRPLRVEHWGDALAQGACAGATAAGRPTAWDEVPGFWSTIGSRTLKYAAWGDGHDVVSFTPGTGAAFTVAYTRDGRLVGLLAHEDDGAYDRAREQIAAGAAWPGSGEPAR